MKLLTKIFLLSLALASCFALAEPMPVFAQTTGADEVRTLENPLGEADTVQKVIGRIARVFLGLVGTGALAMFMWGGARYIWSRGNTKEVEAATQIITWAALGLIMVFISFAAVNFLVRGLEQAGQAPAGQTQPPTETETEVPSENP